ncbi:hypothetical protein QYF61_017224 [Mycteria americana]|uniref:Protein YIF1 n=1 Tax=Mycteria americana TaxID=33587 RepID=A0AAN7MHD4_MYCAM|nr:hypothetical protein QYF61_017224 [Mycteria americana]
MTPGPGDSVGTTRPVGHQAPPRPTPSPWQHQRKKETRQRDGAGRGGRGTVSAAGGGAAGPGPDPPPPPTGLTPPLPAAPKRRVPAAAPRMADPHPLFDDTSAAGGGGAHPGRGYGAPPPASSSSSSSPYPPPASFLSEPVSSLAVAYGSSLASQGRDIVDRNLDRFIPVGRLKYYFAVDTVYVGRKLGAPRLPLCASVMAFITYILVAGLALGTQNRRARRCLADRGGAGRPLQPLPRHRQHRPHHIDLLAFAGYKYDDHRPHLRLLFGRTGYYVVLSWCCLSIFVFMIRTLRLKLLSEAAAEGVLVRGAKNQLRMYLTMAIAAAQPLFMYWLTYHLLR